MAVVQNGALGDADILLSPAQSRVIEEHLDEVELAHPDWARYRVAARQLMAYVLHLHLAFGDRYAYGVPVPWDRIAALEGAPNRGTIDVWEPLESEGLLEATGYGPNWCRQFLAPDALLREFWRAGRRDRLASVTTRHDGFTGTRSRRVRTTKTTYEGGASWSQRSKLMYDVLSYWRKARCVVDREGFELHLERMEREADAAIDAAASAPEDKSALRRSTYMIARVAHESHVWDAVCIQGLVPAEDLGPGVFQFSPAYKVQELSGRLSMIAGGSQNMTTEGKHAAYGNIEGARNYDIVGSHTVRLVEEFELANERGAGLDITVLTEYPGKDALAKEYGVPRSVFKRAEHAPKYGAGFVPTMGVAWKLARDRAKKRLAEWGNTSYYKERVCSDRETWDRFVRSCLPTMAQLALEIAEDDKVPLGDAEDAYSLLREVYGPMAQEMKRWRSWLVTDHWRLHSRPGGRGHFIEGPCGIAFNMYDYPERERGTKYASMLLQGREAAFIHHLTLLGSAYGYEPVANEHDGLIVVGRIPEEAIEEARRLSGFATAKLVEKPFTSADGRRREAASPAEANRLSSDRAPHSHPRTDAPVQATRQALDADSPAG